ncbi:LysE family translocator [Allorhizobium taibaishanense]|uniref:Threonine/homoserine/homoserine lactone efflux protein n=2 Tax=Allorhizobium taibaishanense TaxID=887144 RepID=A0A7W6HIT9_9HYPH|nr:LysE family translocator [Allorhizobium taibaishanense]MBB4005773.1 threonine/homoserine/homoserine lactone efflux protein [Allorhizobium taibaishanense]
MNPPFFGIACQYIPFSSNISNPIALAFRYNIDMNAHLLLLFSATVLPLICTPGPDMLFIASQAVSGGSKAGLRATFGVVLGYGVHSLLVALGLAAVVAASPVLFEAIRWIGIAYLLFLAYKLIRSAMQSQDIAVSGRKVENQLSKGFLTALLNPKGMMIYVAILPQFMDHQAGNVTLQAISLSLAFMFWCAVVYSILSLTLSRLGGGNLNDKKRRLIDGTAGGMILLAAGFMASAQR